MQKNKAGTLYLIRHCHTDADGRCISDTDLPLDDFGLHQAAQLKKWAGGRKLAAVFSSPLKRAFQTAGFLADGNPVGVFNELREVNIGAWEGLTFDEIRLRFRDDYEKRGKHPGTVPPTGGESVEAAGLRLVGCLRDIIDKCEGNVAVVSHGGAIRGALARLLGREPDEALLLPQPWGGVNVIKFSAEGRMTVKLYGEMPEKYPDERSTAFLRDRYKMPEGIRAHCNAVAQKAVLLAIGQNADMGLLYASAMLHDISRENGFAHAESGARLMRESGYPAVAEIIARHHDLGDAAGIEARLLYLADKLVLGDREVSLRERFEESKKKCVTPEAVAAWQRRYDDAVTIAEALGLEV